MNRDMETIVSDVTGDTCLHIRHQSGLHIYLMEMPGYKSSHTLFVTRYGSINNRFRLRGEEQYTEVPAGIAHYLEHKLFENEDCDAFAKFARTGAAANAYTSFDRTAYLFSCSENYADSLRILLQFVQEPYFTPENVEKERGIIGQEIRMNLDDPGWCVFFNMLKGIFHNHPVRIDIAGSEESIQEIDADLLYKCYNTFYNLNNMALCAAGNINAEEVLAICDELLKPCEDQGLEQLFPEEPEGVRVHYTEQQIPVGTPIFSLGFKLRPMEGEALLRADLLSHLVLETLLGPSSDFYNNALRDGLINSEFGVDAPFIGRGFFVLSVNGESRDPEEAANLVIETLEAAQQNGFDRESFERLRRVNYGSEIRSSGNVEANAAMLLNDFVEDCQPFTNLRVLREITYEEALEFLRTQINTDEYTLSVVRADGEEA